MDKIQKIVDELVLQTKPNSSSGELRRTIAVHWTEDSALLEFGNGRRQKVRLSHHGKYYRLVSVVLRGEEVENFKREKILPFLWLRNRETNLVSFSLDKKGRLIGSIEQLYDTVDIEEVIYYLENLAWECDQLEYLLRGTSDSG